MMDEITELLIGVDGEDAAEPSPEAELTTGPPLSQLLLVTLALLKRPSCVHVPTLAGAYSLLVVLR